MASFAPYAYIQCPCTDSNFPTRRLGTESPIDSPDNEQDEPTFDPRAPRANYSLYPLEHLLYCEDCHQIRCPRCVIDELVACYCPNCLFEVPSSTVKSEGNRCTRSCFQCPICIAPLSVSSIEARRDGLGAEYAAYGGPFVLSCAFCNWSSDEIGIQLDKPNSIYNQLAKIRNGGKPVVNARERRREREEQSKIAYSPTIKEEGGEEDDQEKNEWGTNEELDAESQFTNLKAFYQSQLADTPTGSLGLPGDYSYGSPGALSRIMGLYTGSGFADKKSRTKKGIMREAQVAPEGLHIFSPSSDEEAINRLRTEGWDSTVSAVQRKEQLQQQAHFVSELRPTPYLLRTKRSKRCKTCRHILSKPESKVHSTRFRIRLVALNYIPSINIRPLQTSSSSQLTPMKPTQFLLTFKNPLFDSVKVNIATAAQTPGRFPSKVTVLCPQFEVGANTDAWEEALREGDGKGGEREKRRTKAEASEGQHQAEAGKVWERGRNWVSVVVEVIPAYLGVMAPALLKSEALTKDDGPLREDEDVLEIPVFARVEWEADATHDDTAGLAAAGTRDKEVKEKRELAYWCVLGVGRIARD